MKLKLRSFLFWPHLVSGLLAGLVIALLSVTGVLLVFEKPAIRWADPQRLVSVPDGAVRLPVDEQLARATAAKPGKAVTAVTVASDPAAATVVSFGREDGVYVNPYSGEVGPFGGQQTRTFFAKTTSCTASCSVRASAARWARRSPAPRTWCSSSSR